MEPLQLSRDTKVIMLLRLDDLVTSDIKLRYSSRTVLQELLPIVKSKIEQKKLGKIEASFFILGRASMAIIFSCSTLAKVPRIVRSVVSSYGELLLAKNLPRTVFEVYPFPVASLELTASKIEDPLIPVLMFVRTSKLIEAICKELYNAPDISRSIVRIFLGLGVYNVIFYMRVSSIAQLLGNYLRLRKLIGAFWETSTIIGVPEEEHRPREIELGSKCEHAFSIMARVDGPTEDVVVRNILKLKTDERFCNMLKGDAEPKFSYRQGYMDLEIPCIACSISALFDLITEIRKLENVTDTVTVAHLEIV